MTSQGDAPLSVMLKKMNKLSFHNYVCYNYTRDKNIYNVRGVGMANESTKTTQTSVRMAQHNERTRLHDLFTWELKYIL